MLQTLQNPDIWKVIQKCSYPGKLANSFHNIQRLEGVIETNNFQIINTYVNKLLTNILPQKNSTKIFLLDLILDRCSADVCAAMLKSIYGKYSRSYYPVPEQAEKVISVLFRDKDYQTILSLQEYILHVVIDMECFCEIVTNSLTMKPHKSVAKHSAQDIVSIMKFLNEIDEIHISPTHLLDVCLIYAMTTVNMELIILLDQKYSIKNCFTSNGVVNGATNKFAAQIVLSENFDKNMYDFLHSKCRFFRNGITNIDIGSHFLLDNNVEAIQWIYQNYTEDRITISCLDFWRALLRENFASLDCLYENHRKYLFSLIKDSMIDKLDFHDAGKIVYNAIHNINVRRWLRGKIPIEYLEEYISRCEIKTFPHHHSNWLYSGSLSKVVKKEHVIVSDFSFNTDGTIDGFNPKIFMAKVRYVYHNYHSVEGYTNLSCFRLRTKYFTVENAPYLLDCCFWIWNVYKYRSLETLLRLYTYLCNDPTICRLQKTSFPCIELINNTESPDPSNIIIRHIQKHRMMYPEIPEKFYVLFDIMYRDLTG